MTLYSETRLTQVMDGPTGTPIETDAYDATGNRTALTNAGNTTAYSYPIGSHHLSSVGGQNRTYDAGGNTLTIGGNGRRFVYDNSGRMTQVKAGGIVMRQYQYNAKGEQTRAYLDADNAYFVHDEAGHLLGEYDASGTPTQQILWFGDLPVGVLQGSGASQQLHYIEPDHLGTPRVIIDGQRNVPIWEWGLTGEAFGNSPPNQDPDHDGQSFTFDLRFPGQRYDSATGLNYNYFRDYDPTTGRYVESDPIGLAGGLSTYSYVGSQPLTSLDLFGLQQTTVDSYCRQHPVECAALFSTGALVVTPKPQTITVPQASSTEKCKTCTEVYPEYDLCSEMSRYYPYASAAHSLLDFPRGSKPRPGMPAERGLCAMRGTHHTVFLNGAYMGSIFSCRCCTNTGGGPVLSEIWGNNRGR